MGLRPHLLTPPIDLPAPPRLLQSISERYFLLRREGDSHPVFNMSPKKWKKRARELASAATKDGVEADRALIELCRIDPRFIRTELAMAKIIDWKLQVIFADIRFPHAIPSKSAVSVRPTADEIKTRKAADERRRVAAARVAQAGKNLAKLGKSVSTSTGRGKKGYRLRHQVRRSFDFYEALFTDVRKQLQSKCTERKVRKIVDEWGVSEDIVRAVKDASRLEGLVDEQLASEYRISKDRIRGLRTQGRRKK